MLRTRTFTLCVFACWGFAVQVDAASSKVSGQASQRGEATVKAADAAATADHATEASAEVRTATAEELQAIRQRGSQAKAKARAEAEAKLNSAARELEQQVAAKGEAAVTARLAGEFGMSEDALLRSKQAFAVSWGEILIAHTLQANAEIQLTVQQMLGLRAEGLGWGQIAAGLGFELSHVVEAVRAETKVALGRSQADGKVAVIRGSKLDAGANTNAAVRAGNTGARVGATVGGSVAPGLPSVKPF